VRPSIHLLIHSLLAMALFAQPRRERHPHETFAGHRVQDLTRRFELTETQRTQALAIFTDADKEAEPLEERLEQAHRDLRDATRRNATSSEIDQLANAVGTLTGQLAAINAKADTAFHNTLTPKQRESFQRGPRGRRGPPPPRR
jgi:Spy/CpxP family protein refolding chaperone